MATEMLSFRVALKHGKSLVWLPVTDEIGSSNSAN
jgi:hypothetical protein